jgi:poly-beta-1,6-N-acetyl-D-glucosamine synthase
MKFLFWFSLGCVAYAYVGYALVLWLRAALRTKRVIRAQITPTVSIIIAARNEEKNIARKLENLRLLNYPQDRLQVVVASDGSTDGTADILRSHADIVTAVVLEQNGGKAIALNEAVRRATGEILVFLDARQTVDEDAVAQLVEPFANPEVGAVSGELHLEAADGESAGEALGVYWKIEKAVRKLESATGSVVGVTGAIYALRRELWSDLPRGTILDDIYVPMIAVRAGKRVLFEPAAVARDKVFAEPGKEFSRKVRTLTGNYQLVQLMPWLLSASNPLLFRLISHKLARLAVPLFLVLLLVTSFFAYGIFYRVLFWAQVALYALAAAGAMWPQMRRFRAVSITHTFVMLNAAAAVAFYNFIVGRDRVWG